LYFDGVVVTDLPFKAIVMVRTEHFIVGKNPDGHAQMKELHWSPIPALLIKEKKK
jgi:hypothetical protein